LTPIGRWFRATEMDALVVERYVLQASEPRPEFPLD
jgi:hypothetical protein